MQEKIFKFNYTNLLDDNFTAHIFSAWHHLAWGEQALSCASNITPTEEYFEIGIKCICNYQEKNLNITFCEKRRFDENNEGASTGNLFLMYMYCTVCT